MGDRSWWLTLPALLAVFQQGPDVVCLFAARLCWKEIPEGSCGHSRDLPSSTLKSNTDVWRQGLAEEASSCPTSGHCLVGLTLEVEFLMGSELAWRILISPGCRSCAKRLETSQLARAAAGGAGGLRHCSTAAAGRRK